MSDQRFMLECMSDFLISDVPEPATGPVPRATDQPMPMERLEARICELAGHLAAATCQFLLLVGDFDERAGWASWEMPSCAAWLAWKCQLAPGTAREQVRVARALRQLPVIRGEFAAGRLSYAKVRALTRIATPESEYGLVETTTSFTAGQLERFVRAYRKVERGEQDGRSAVRTRKLSWRHDETGISITVSLPPEEGAVVLQAMRAWMNDVDDRLRESDAHAGVDWGSELRPWNQEKAPAENLADALTGICGDYLSARAAVADNPDNYQVIIHAGTGAITGVSAETPSQRALAMLRETVPLLAFPESHPAYAWRSHVEDGAAIDTATLRMIACNATISTMLHDEDGKVLNVGRRSRKPSAALRRAVRERDRYRCRFPGCESRRVDLHHLRFWANGGATRLENLICLCKRHHAIVHEKGLIIAASSAGFTFRLPGGAMIPNAPPLPGGSPADLAASHGAEITCETIIPPHSGGRLDLHEAIWICFHNARIQAAA